MKFAAETSAGPLELEVTQLSGGMLVRIASTNDTWNSTYTPVPLSAFLAEFARLPETEAAEISERVLADWEVSGESTSPRLRTQSRKVLAAGMPAAVLIF